MSRDMEDLFSSKVKPSIHKHETLTYMSNDLSPTEYQKLLELAQMNNVNIELLAPMTRALEAQDRWLLDFRTVNPQMIEIKDYVRKIADVPDPCMIIGESGTGKELLANALHGKRPKDTFLAINCAGIPEQLIETELFGHVRGAFTGAIKDKVGLLEEARNGTVFLDEIGEMAVGVQAKLLRAVQCMKVKRVGDNVERAINCRFVCATNKSVNQTELFRSDLYYRLSTFELKTSPLRSRLEDVLPIISALLKCSEKNIPLVWHQAVDSMKNMPLDNLMPGNVRQLQKLVRRYQVLGLVPKREDWL